MKHPARKLGPAPDATRLREAALQHLARFAASEATLKQILTRRITRWAHAAAQAGIAPDIIEAAQQTARASLPALITQLRSLGALNDQAFAESRARRLARSGKSRSASLAHLTAKGIDPDLAASALPPDPARDLTSACILLRRRRLPPFAPGDRLKTLGILARAGFDRATAEHAISMDAQTAEALVLAARQ